MIIKTSGIPEFEIPDEALVDLPYITSLFKLTEDGATAMYLMLADKPMYYISNLLDLVSEYSYSGGGLYFIDLPSNYMLLTVGSEDGVNVEMEPVGDSTSTPIDELIGNLLFMYLLITMGNVGSCMPTYSNYDIYYAWLEDINELPVTDEKIAYIGDTSEPIMLSAPSSAFQSIADFVRVSFGNSDFMNSTALLEKIKTISGINSEILTTKYTPNEECISLLNGIHENNFYNTDATSVKNSFFADNTELTYVDLPKVTVIGDDVFYGCSSLIDVNLPKVIIAGTDAFRNCKSIVSLSLPELKETGSGCFFDCTSLKNVNLPNLEDLGMGSTFENCISLEQLVLPKCNDMGNYTFEGCTKLKVIDFHRDIPSVNQNYFTNATALQALILRSTTMSKLYSSSVTGTFNGTPIKEGKGFIYVPKELLSAYKTDSLWSKWASYFRPLEDYTIDGTRMGELDWSKIETATGEQ